MCTRVPRVRRCNHAECDAFKYTDDRRSRHTHVGFRVGFSHATAHRSKCVLVFVVWFFRFNPSFVIRQRFRFRTRFPRSIPSAGVLVINRFYCCSLRPGNVSRAAAANNRHDDFTGKALSRAPTPRNRVALYARGVLRVPFGRRREMNLFTERAGRVLAAAVVCARSTSDRYRRGAVTRTIV